MARLVLSSGHDDGTTACLSDDLFSVYDATPVARRADASQVAITDNSTGTVGNTIAAGVGVSTLFFAVTLPTGGTSAIDLVTAFTPGYKFKILAWGYHEAVAATGSGGSRVYNMEIGTTDVGTTPSTVTITTAVGRQIAGTAVSGANTGSASDTISIEVAASGTTHDAGSGAFWIRIQNMDTADAVASLADKSNEWRAALTAFGIITGAA
jgi:hypothetical protein